MFWASRTPIRNELSKGLDVRGARRPRRGDFGFDHAKVQHQECLRARKALDIEMNRHNKGSEAYG